MRLIRRPGRLGLGLYGLVFFAFIYLPMAVVLVFSFNSNVVNMMSWQGFTLDWYRSIFGLQTRLTEQALYVESTEQLVAAVQNSLILAGCCGPPPRCSRPRSPRHGRSCRPAASAAEAR